ncbi:MAG: hypothetical protein RQ879_00920 [Sulfolobales archaeon]|nr:hypothetical protein [Sulfolobales archaeon]
MYIVALFTTRSYSLDLEYAYANGRRWTNDRKPRESNKMIIECK